MAATLAATKIGLLKRKAVKEIARKLSLFNNEEFIQAVLSALQTSQFKMPLLQTFLDTILRDEDAKQTLSKLVCSFALEYSSLMLSTKGFPPAVRYITSQIQWLQRVRVTV